MSKPLALLCLFFASHIAWADGGRLRLHEPAGPFIVTLFTTPDPLTAGRADFSVAVERAGEQGLNTALLQDAEVTLVLTAEDASATSSPDRLVVPATHAAASSAFLQAANLTLPHAGVWKITILVHHGTGSGECSGEIDVLPCRITADQTAWEIAVVPIAMLLFAMHQARKARRRHR